MSNDRNDSFLQDLSEFFRYLGRFLNARQYMIANPTQFLMMTRVDPASALYSAPLIAILFTLT